jgi:hypothetical protein
MPPLDRLNRLYALDDLVKSVRHLSQWLRYAEARVAKGTTGDKTAGARAVTRGIDDLLFRHKGYRLTPTQKHPDPGKDLLDACLALLKMEVTADSMVRYLASKRRNKVPSKKN